MFDYIYKFIFNDEKLLKFIIAFKIFYYNT